ncbi:nucleoside/nucleotide kinase family protein [Limnohabitans sp.]|uniref:nucleoside/nucleotide kinase family protein n=1 Tax=Limnohabitans sp. TaxID=1907725 RepID=UPI00286F0654|nr:nucleoside/nucleotide kinase family protein [Limnohabitans sp.]
MDLNPKLPTLPAFYQQRIEALLARGSRRLLGLVGAPGAGKSTLAQVLASQWPGQIQVVPMDGFHLANVELDRLGRRQRKGAPDTFDAFGFVALLKRLRTQAVDDVVYAPSYERSLEEGIAGAIAIEANTPLLVVEGNYLLLNDSPWNQVQALLDETWFVDVPQDLRVGRLTQRHQQFGRSAQDAADWVQHTDEPNARRIEAAKAKADVMFRWDS